MLNGDWPTHNTSLSPYSLRLPNGFFGMMSAPFPPNSPTIEIGRRSHAVRFRLFSLLVALCLSCSPCTALCVPYPKGRFFQPEERRVFRPTITSLLAPKEDYFHVTLRKGQKPEPLHALRARQSYFGLYNATESASASRFA